MDPPSISQRQPKRQAATLKFAAAACCGYTLRYKNKTEIISLTNV